MNEIDNNNEIHDNQGTYRYIISSSSSTLSVWCELTHSYTYVCVDIYIQLNNIFSKIFAKDNIAIEPYFKELFATYQVLELKIDDIVKVLTMHPKYKKFLFICLYMMLLLITIYVSMMMSISHLLQTINWSIEL